MNTRIRSSLIGGVFGFAIALISGGFAGILAGLVAGLINGFSVPQAEPLNNRAGAVRQGLVASLIASVLTILGIVIRSVLIDPVIGTPLNISSLLISIIGALILGIPVCVIMCVIRTEPPARERIGLAILIGIVLVTYPWLDQFLNLRFMNEVIPVLVFILMALGLNIVVGYAGLLDLGYAAFFAIGAYAAGMVSSPHFGISLSFWLAIWVAAAVAAVFGLILGSPTLPLRGDYLAIVTLGFGEIVPIAIKNLDKVTIHIWNYPLLVDFDFTGGTKGINPINRPWLPVIGEFSPSTPIPWYFLILGIMLISIFFISRLRNSRLGRAWTALREDELAAGAMGINTVNVKLLAFAIGATVSGLAGAFYGSYISAIFPESFRFDVSVMLLCMVILGGLGNMSGVILGGIIIQFADRLFLPQFSTVVQKLIVASGNESLREVNFASDFRLLLFGLTLVLMMILRPQGLVPSGRAARVMPPVDAEVPHD
jgi:branched-chain amino acid transport system permease protein